MITIKNRIRSIAVNTQHIERDTQEILKFLDYAEFDVGILLTTNKTIRYYNATYRHKDKATDILSFPYHPTLKAGERILVTHPEDTNLGDLIISLEYVQDAAKKLGVTFEQRMRVLLVHGICHLLGYDHIEDPDYLVMHALEKKIIAHLDALHPLPTEKST